MRGHIISYTKALYTGACCSAACCVATVAYELGLAHTNGVYIQMRTCALSAKGTGGKKGPNRVDFWVPFFCGNRETDYKKLVFGLERTTKK